MPWDAIGAIGEVVGAAAVVITLIYLASQVRQTGRAIVGQTDMDFTRELVAFQARIASDREKIAVWEKAATNSDLTDMEGLQYVMLTSEWFILADGCYRQWRRGLMPFESFEVISDICVSLITHDEILVRWWETRITPLSPGFITYLEKERDNWEAKTFRREGTTGSMQESLAKILNGGE